MIMRVIGVERNCFNPPNSDKEICGFNVYLASDVPAENGLGARVERQYVSDAKAAAWSIDVLDLMGHMVEVHHNHWRKLAFLTVLD